MILQKSTWTLRWIVLIWIRIWNIYHQESKWYNFRLNFSSHHQHCKLKSSLRQLIMMLKQQSTCQRKYQSRWAWILKQSRTQTTINIIHFNAKQIMCLLTDFIKRRLSKTVLINFFKTYACKSYINMSAFMMQISDWHFYIKFCMMLKTMSDILECSQSNSVTKKFKKSSTAFCIMTSSRHFSSCWVTHHFKTSWSTHSFNITMLTTFKSTMRCILLIDDEKRRRSFLMMLSWYHC